MQMPNVVTLIYNIKKKEKENMKDDKMVRVLVKSQTYKQLALATSKNCHMKIKGQWRKQLKPHQ